MNIDDKLAAILAAVQTDPGNRGLARDPHDNLLTATADDFQAACQSIAGTPQAAVGVVTGFFIPTASPPAAETDGPLGTLFLTRAFLACGIQTFPLTDEWCIPALQAGIHFCDLGASTVARRVWMGPVRPVTHLLAVERVGPNHTWDSVQQQRVVHRPVTRTVSHELFHREVPPTHQNRCYTMRGIDITDVSRLHPNFFGSWFPPEPRPTTIGIGDGGNEIGMGKIPWSVIRNNIPNGGLIACRVPTDYLIVCGVSNWGAYALAAGVFVLRGVKPPADLFDPDREREILEVMVREGPLVDGVTGKQTATVDGLTWEEYVKPLVRIREILES